MGRRGDRGNERPPPGDRDRLRRELAEGRVPPELRRAYKLWASGVSVTIEDYEERLDALTWDGLVLIREVVRQEEQEAINEAASGRSGAASARSRIPGGFELEPVEED